MPRLTTTMLALSLTLALGAACSKGSGDGKGENAGKPAEGKTSGPKAESLTLPIGAFTVEAKVPSGWTKNEFGGGVIYAHESQGLMTSNYFITPGCQGDCSKVADNVVGFVDEQKRQHEASGYKVEVGTSGELPGGGREFRLEITRGTEAMTQVVAMHHQAGWEEAVTCSATLLKEDRAQADAFAGWCRDLKVALR
jgi:hypothetical protein